MAADGRPYRLKAWLDYSVSAVASVLLFPLLMVSILAIRLESAGPGIFRQVRVGCDGRSFVCYKLRTMRIDTENLPSHAVASSAVTRVGKFMRRTKLDELPQFWNVLRGDMSIVGHRPCLPMQTQLVEARRRRGVLALKPGITGVSQVAGVDMSDPERLAELDATYLPQMSLGTDIRLIVATVFGAGRGDRVKPGS